jgi:hypothetical protein
MKKIFNIISLFAIAAITLVSCQKEQEKHEPGPADVTGCYGVYFPSQPASGSHAIAPEEDTSFKFIAARTNDSGAITVPVKVTSSAENVFVVPPITFADGQKETEFIVSFPTAEIGVTYSLSLTIEDPQYASYYSSSPISIDFSVLREKWNSLGTGLWRDDFFTTFYGVSNLEWEVEVLENDITKGLYRVVYPYDSKYAYNDPGDWDDSKVYYFEIHAENPNKVYFDRQDIGVRWSYGIIRFNSMAGYYLAKGDASSAEEYYGTLSENGVITFPTGGLLISMDNYNSGSQYVANNSGLFRLCLPGAVLTDYTIKELSADYPSGGETPVYIETGLDVASIKYAVYEGELTPTQVGYKVDAIKAGTEETTTFSDFEVDEKDAVKYATLNISPEATGYYTFVTVAFDKDGEAQSSASTSFKFITKEEEADYEVDLNVFTEDTPFRYTTLHDYDSFAFGIYGKDLTDVHYGIFDLSKIKSLTEAVAAVKEDAKGTYAVSDEVLAEINALGGYYNVATKLNASTTYVLLVWATNGSLDTFDLDIYKTNRLPYVWNSLGEGLYTEDVAGGLYKIGPVDVACNVFEEKTTPGLYMINGFQKNYIQTLFDGGAFGEEMIGVPAEDYEDILWRDVDLVIDATNPDNVTIELQDYGICLNTSEGFIDGLTSVFDGEPFSVGTLKDGVISFPTARGLLCLLDGDGYYYANQDGAFKIVLPSDAPAEPAVASFTNTVIRPVTKANFAKEMKQPVYERDPKPVQAKVSVSHERKEFTPIEKSVVKAHQSSVVE